MSKIDKLKGVESRDERVVVLDCTMEDLRMEDIVGGWDRERGGDGLWLKVRVRLSPRVWWRFESYRSQHAPHIFREQICSLLLPMNTSRHYPLHRVMNFVLHCHWVDGWSAASIGHTGWRIRALLCGLKEDVIHPFIAAMVFIGVSRLTLHLLSITIGACNFISSLLQVDRAMHDFKSPTWRYLHFELEQSRNNIIFQ